MSFIPKSVVRTSRKEGCWALDVHLQEQPTDYIVPASNLPAAELPPGLHGYAFIVGALFQAENKPQEYGTQLYTGDGMIYRLGFESGKAILKTRIAKTPCYYADPPTQFYLGSNVIEPPPPASNPITSYFVEKYKLFCYFAAFRNGGPSRFSLLLGSRNQLNTAFLKTRDHLLLTIDAGRPYCLDPESMELTEPVGSTQQWFSIFPVISRLTWINIFETYINSAHYVTDVSRTVGKQDELFTTNYSTGYNGSLKLINWILDSKLFRKIVKIIYAVFQQRFEIKREFGRFTYLVRYRFADEQNEIKPTVERWRLLLPGGKKPLLVNQSLHQLGITESYIILGDITFRMEFSQIFSPFIFGFLRLPVFNRMHWLGSLIQSIFLQQVKPLSYTNLYIVKREDLDRAEQPAPTADVPENVPEITVQVVKLPRETSHFAVNYSNPDQQITLQAGHINGWDVTEWITRYDRPVADRVFRPDLEGMMVGATDLGSLGRYVIDGETGKILSSKTVADTDSTWSLSVYTHRDINRDSMGETDREVKNIYWLSLGFTWELIPQRIYEAYKADPNRIVAVEQLPEGNKPITLLRLDTERMVIADTYHFPAGTFVSSIQFISSSLPCTDGLDESMHGFIVCAVLLDPPDRQESRHPEDEFWVFHADDFSKPVYRLCAQSGDPPLNLAMTIHSTWLEKFPSEPPSVLERQQKREISIKTDYDRLLQNKSAIVRALFQDIVYPNFINQTLEEDFEKSLLSENKE